MGCVELRPLANNDQTDYAPRPLRPSNLDFICLGLSILLHVLDLGSDVVVAVSYNDRGEFYYFLCTILIVIIPSVVTTCVSYRMYSIDAEDEISYVWNRKKKLRIVMLFLQLAPLLRYIDSLRYAWRSRQAEKKKNIEEQERNYKLMLKEDADVALLRVFKSFLEAAPQLILQISFLLKHGFELETTFSEWKTKVSIVLSFLGMAHCLMTYQRNIRFVQEDKDNISLIGSSFIFLWHLLVTISRILMLSAMVYIAWNWTLLAMCLHWIIMSISLAIMESHDFCSSASAIKFKQNRIYDTVANFLFSAVLGLVYIFTYITPGEGRTFWRYLCFYTSCFLENIGGAVIWYVYESKSLLTYIMTALFIVPFILGCFFMIFYHWKFHPKHYIPPSILPQRSKKHSSGEAHIPDTPSPKSVKEPSAACNGTISHGDHGDSDFQELKSENTSEIPKESQSSANSCDRGQGDCEMHTNVAH